MFLFQRHRPVRRLRVGVHISVFLVCVWHSIAQLTSLAPTWSCSLTKHFFYFMFISNWAQTIRVGKRLNWCDSLTLFHPSCVRSLSLSLCCLTDFLSPPLPFLPTCPSLQARINFLWGWKAIKRRVDVNARRIMGAWWAVQQLLQSIGTFYTHCFASPLSCPTAKQAGGALMGSVHECCLNFS